MSKKTNDPTKRHQNDTEPSSHDGGVVQWTADGQVPVISHDTEEETFSCAQGKEEIKLSEATREGYGLGFGKKIEQHVGDRAGHIPDLQEGEVGQEHVHGGVESVVPPHCTNDGYIPSQSQDVDKQDHCEKDDLHFPGTRKAQQDKVCHSRYP